MAAWQLPKGTMPDQFHQGPQPSLGPLERIALRAEMCESKLGPAAKEVNDSKVPMALPKAFYREGGPAQGETAVEALVVQGWGEAWRVDSFLSPQ